MGHRAAECRSRYQEPVPRARAESQQESVKKGKACYICSSADHLAYACPNRGKGAPVKPERVRFAKVALRDHSDEGEANIIFGRVAGKDYEFVLDSGASISVVPEEMVRQKQYTGEMVSVADTNGGKETRRVAIIDIWFQTCVWSRRVAVASRNSMADGALLAINLNNKEHMRLVAEYCCSKERKVMAVQTRAKVAAEKQCLREEN